MIDRAREIESDWGAQTEQLRESALQFSAVARERFAEGTDRLKQYVVKEPTRALGLALGLGVLLGWLIKRR